MAKANTPPKNSGRALPRVYLAQQGQSKVCDTCGETKEIARNTFGPDRKSPDGIASTCRACVGRRGAMLRHHGLDEHGQKIDGPKSEEGDPRQRGYAQVWCTGSGGGLVLGGLDGLAITEADALDHLGEPLRAI